MTKANLWFESPRVPSEALAAFENMALDRGWRVKARTDDSITARRPLNIQTLGELVTVTAAPGGQTGSYIDVSVKSRQILDWGASKALASEVRERLS